MNYSDPSLQILLKTTKQREKITLQCSLCNASFLKGNKEIKRAIREGCKTVYCSKQCFYKAQIKKTKYFCKHCGIEFFALPKDTPLFCSRKCAGIYNNTHKIHGYSRSNLEMWLEKQLKEKYKALEILFNNRNIINSELDIYIPKLQLAFELNGIFHYEPIYGKETLEKIQNNDNRKFQACLEQQIELCIINASDQNRFTVKSSQKYLDIIVELIEAKAQL